MPYVIVYKKMYRRVRLNGELTPVFKYPQQAIRFIELYLRNSPNVTIYKVSG
jgi:hypothetical protein